MHLAKVWALANTLLCTTLSKSLALTTEISTNQLQKRDMILDCGTLPIPPLPPSAEENNQLRSFRTFSEICTTSPNGFQLSCDEEGHITRPPRFGRLWRQSNRWLLDACILQCWCHELAPSTPKFRESSRKSFDSPVVLDEDDPFATGGQQPFSGRANSKSGTQCYRHDQCDLRQGYICSQPVPSSVPASDNWLHFQCNHVPHVAEAMQVALKSSRCQSGRCLLESNGSVVSSSSLTGNMTTLNLTASHDYVDGTLVDDTSSDHPAPSENANTSTNESHSVVNEVDEPGLTPSQTSSTITPPVPLVCPCNCTYFEFGCCFSDVVEMHPYQSSYDSMDWRPPFPGLICDPWSGLWLVRKGADQIYRTKGSHVSPSNVTLPPMDIGGPSEGGGFDLLGSIPLPK